MSITAEIIGGPADVIVADLSFISLKLVLRALLACSRPGTTMMLMVKPQFEVGKNRVGAGGVVRDPALRAESVLGVALHAHGLGLEVVDVAASPLPGPSGNVEYFLWLHVPENVHGNGKSQGLSGELSEGVASQPVSSSDHERSKLRHYDGGHTLTGEISSAESTGSTQIMNVATSVPSRSPNPEGVKHTDAETAERDILESMIARAVQEGPQ